MDSSLFLHLIKPHKSPRFLPFYNHGQSRGIFESKSRWKSFWASLEKLQTSVTFVKYNIIIQTDRNLQISKERDKKKKTSKCMLCNDGTDYLSDGSNHPVENEVTRDDRR